MGIYCNYQCDKHKNKLNTCWIFKMSLQYLCDGPEQHPTKYNKHSSDEYYGNNNLTRSNTPEYEKINNSDNYSDRDSTMESLRSTRILSSSSSMTSVDLNDPASFEIEYFLFFPPLA